MPLCGYGLSFCVTYDNEGSSHAAAPGNLSFILKEVGGGTSFYGEYLGRKDTVCGRYH